MNLYILLLCSVLSQVPTLPDAPEPKTHAEAILIWGIGLCIAAIVVMFAWVNRIHAGHKDQIRQQAETNATQIREQEQAYAQALREQMERDQTHRDQESNRLFGILEKAIASSERTAGAVETLNAEVRATRMGRSD